MEVIIKCHGGIYFCSRNIIHTHKVGNGGKQEGWWKGELLWEARLDRHTHVRVMTKEWEIMLLVQLGSHPQPSECVVGRTQSCWDLNDVPWGGKKRISPVTLHLSLIKGSKVLEVLEWDLKYNSFCPRLGEELELHLRLFHSFFILKVGNHFPKSYF